MNFDDFASNLPYFTARFVHFLYLRPHGVVAGGILLYCRSFFLSFSFAKGSPRWLYRQGTFIAQMVGYRCNFKNWVQNLGATPLQFGGPKPPNVVNQSWKTWSKLILGIGRENEYPKLV